MPNPTTAEYNALLARQLPKLAPGARAGGVEREGDLHTQIMNECARRGWLYFHGAMSKQTHRTAGEPDLLVYVECGRHFMIECKTRTGKLSIEQQAIAAHARKLGHTVHVVRSLPEFLEVVK